MYIDILYLKKLKQLLILNGGSTNTKTSLSGSVIDIVIKIGNLRTVPVECHGDDTPLIFHDTSLFSLLILLVHVSKFNVHDTPIILPLRLVLGVQKCKRRNAPLLPIYTLAALMHAVMHDYQFSIPTL